MKVYKFGGASVKDADGVRNLMKIVTNTAGELVVVVSAMGKTTNALERVVSSLMASCSAEAYTEWCGVIDYHRAIIADLGLPEELIAWAEEIPDADTSDYDRCYDQIVSVGELISTRIVAAALWNSGCMTTWWNMPSLLLTDATYREARVNMEVSAMRIQDAWAEQKRNRVVIAQGFIGGTEDGLRTTLGREGSDYSAALLANYLGAESVTIWKDVPGILNADPRLEPNTTLIPELNYSDAVELAFSGAQVIHPKTIRPLANKHIPLYVRPFGEPDAEGTVIHSERKAPITVPVYIWRKNQVLITMRAKDFSFVLEESLSDIFGIIHANRLKVSLIQSSAVTISVAVDNTRFVQRAIDQLGARFNVTYNEGLSLLTIRGTNKEILKTAQEGRDVLLTQLTRNTAKFIIKE